jgi:hypothetical protein
MATVLKQVGAILLYDALRSSFKFFIMIRHDHFESFWIITCDGYNIC